MTRQARSVGVAVALAVLLVLTLLVGRGLSSDPGSTGAAPAASSAAKTTPRPSALTTKKTPPDAAQTRSTRDPDSGLPLVDLEMLPRQVSDTVALIERGGPYRNRQDGAVFGNRERILPRKASGFYHEYTVETPGSGDRGARRVVTGDRDREFFYTGDHYASFVRIRP